MRLTSSQVTRVVMAVERETGHEWMTSYNPGDGKGPRYLPIQEGWSRPRWLGSPGAAAALSYLSGVSAVYKVDVSHFEVLSYLRESGRFDAEAEATGRESARTVQDRALEDNLQPYFEGLKVRATRSGE